MQHSQPARVLSPECVPGFSAWGLVLAGCVAAGCDESRDVACQLVVAVLCHVQAIIQVALAAALIHGVEVHGTSLRTFMAFMAWMVRMGGRGWKGWSRGVAAAQAGGSSRSVQRAGGRRQEKQQSSVHVGTTSNLANTALCGPQTFWACLLS